MKTQDILEEYGLSQKEAKVYMQLLSLGETNLQRIAKKINLPRTTIYNTLNYLIEKGLASYITKKHTRFYKATEPKKLINKLEEKKSLIKSILPELESLKKAIPQDSSVEIFQGTKGLFTILSDIFNKKQMVYYFGSYTLSNEILKHQPEHFRTIRLDKKIPAKIIIEEYEEKTFKTKEYKKITDMRFNNSLKDFPCMIFIYGQKVALYTLKQDIIGIIISNKQVAESIKLIFDLYWQNSKPAKL